MLEDALENLDTASRDSHIKDLADRVRDLQNKYTDKPMEDAVDDEKRTIAQGDTLDKQAGTEVR